MINNNIIKLCFLGYFLLIPFLGLNQTHIDSLKSDLSQLSGKEKADILYKISTELKSAYHDSAAYYANRAMAIYSELKDSSGLVNGYNVIAEVLNHTGKLDSAAVVCYKAIEIAKSIGSENISVSYLQLGNVYMRSDDIELALKYYQYAVQTDNEFTKAAAYSNLGNIYLDTNLDSAEICFKSMDNLVNC